MSSSIKFLAPVTVLGFASLAQSINANADTITVSFSTANNTNNTNNTINLTVKNAATATAGTLQTITENNQVAVNDINQVISNTNGVHKVINLTLKANTDYNAVSNNHKSQYSIPSDLSHDKNIEDYMTILSSIYYSDAFKNMYFTDPDQSVYYYIKKFQQLPESQRSGLDTVTGGKANAQAVINTVLQHSEVYDNLILVDVDHSEYAGAPTAPIINDGYVYKLTFLYGNDMIIYYAGTAGDIEWVNNSKGFYDSDTSSDVNALSYFDQQYARYGKGRNVYTIGVSNGGKKAAYVGVLRGDKIAHTYSFAGEGFSDAFVKKYAAQIKNYSSKLTTLASNEDVIHSLLPNIVATAEYHQIQKGDGSAFNAIMGTHAPFGMLKIKPDGTIGISEVVNKNPYAQYLGGFTSFAGRYLPQSTFSAFSNQLQGLFVNQPKLYFSNVFNFAGFTTEPLKNPLVWVNRAVYWTPKIIQLMGAAVAYARNPNSVLSTKQAQNLVNGVDSLNPNRKA